MSEEGGHGHGPPPPGRGDTRGCPPDSSLGRRIVLSSEGSLHVYLLLDASGSVRSENFHLFQECGAAIVDRVGHGVGGDTGLGDRH